MACPRLSASPETRFDPPETRCGKIQPLLPSLQILAGTPYRAETPPMTFIFRGDHPDPFRYNSLGASCPVVVIAMYTNMIISVFVLIFDLIHLTTCLPLGHPLSLSERTGDASHAPFTASTSKLADRQDGNRDTVLRDLEIGDSIPITAATAHSARNVYLADPFTEHPSDSENLN